MTWRCLAFAILMAAASCGGTVGSEEPVVFAAASLEEVLPAIDRDARYNFAGSDELALQLREGAAADVYASADAVHARRLFNEGLVRRPKPFATNTLVLIVPRANPAHISSIEDLRGPHVKLVVGAEGVPIGDYTRELLTALHASLALESVVSEEEDVKGIVGKVASGEADAGFVYATDVGPVADEVRSIALPKAAQPRVEYQIAVVRSTDRDGAAEEFVALVLGDEGRGILRTAGFGLP